MAPRAVLAGRPGICPQPAGAGEGALPALGAESSGGGASHGGLGPWRPPLAADQPRDLAAGLSRRRRFHPTCSAVSGAPSGRAVPLRSDARMMLRQILERLFFVVERAVTAILYPYCLLRERHSTRVPILMYHQVGHPLASMPEPQDCVTPERFERQLRALLDSGYQVISVGRLIQLLDDSPHALRRCFALTFDDGFHGQFRNAYPILRRYGVPATFFLVAGFVGSPTPPPPPRPLRGPEGANDPGAERGPTPREGGPELPPHPGGSGLPRAPHPALGG